ncbi:DUF2894 domain-containing protein [Cognatilysobacter segetis]|uniref:DUF2894 domain-containing protein n=1 Tax=Cognatilysobacter segetis TaxID=2492394 RepID=UPI00105CA3C7|nr:DUF2894 domain-containing protein [Lysobacter segetis]
MKADEVRQRLADWRERGIADVDPLGYARIVALEQRASASSGGVRDLLEARLTALVDAYASNADAQPRTGPHEATTAPASGGLRGLLAHLATHADRHDATPGAAQAEDGASLEAIRRLSARVRTESQVRQALEEAPQNAGPLNSAHLVHRALLRMCDDAPEYLAAFMGYVDTLARLEAMTPGAAVPDPSGAPRRRRRRTAAGG